MQINKANIWGRIHAFRWHLGILTFFVCVCLQLHGSSIGFYSTILHTPSNELIGSFRPVRSDEYVVNTPLAFSQYYNEFAYSSDIVRGTPTDMFMVYGQPVKDIAVVFRPFHWGYLFLPPGMGLSFFWMGRLIFLFLISYEFGRIICNQKKIFAFLYAIIMTFSPLVQWWFDVNSIAEILIFGQLLIIGLHWYIREPSYRRRIAIIGMMAWAAGGYIFSVYPAWQISCGYVFLGVAIWTVMTNKMTFSYGIRDAVVAAGAVCLVGLLAGRTILQSWEFIETMQQTVYPGHRFITGMNVSLQDFLLFGMNYILGILLAFKEVSSLWGLDQEYVHQILTELARNQVYRPEFFSYTVMANNCEAARMFDFVPLGILLSIMHWKLFGKMDSLLGIMIVTLLLMLCWGTLSWPAWLAKISLMSNVTFRILFATGIVNTILLVRAMSIYENRISWKNAIPIAISGSILTLSIGYFSYPDAWDAKWLIIGFVAVTFLWLGVLRQWKRLLPIGMASIVLYTGLSVNPIAYGAESIYGSSVVNKIQEIASQDKGKWLVVGGIAVNDIPIMAGGGNHKQYKYISCLGTLETARSAGRSTDYIQ